MQGKSGLALLDDRDLAAYEESAAGLRRVTRAEAPSRFGFVPIPVP